MSCPHCTRIFLPKLPRGRQWRIERFEEGNWPMRTGHGDRDIPLRPKRQRGGIQMTNDDAITTVRREHVPGRACRLVWSLVVASLPFAEEVLATPRVEQRDGGVAIANDLSPRFGPAVSHWFSVLCPEAWCPSRDCGVDTNPTPTTQPLTHGSGIRVIAMAKCHRASSVWIGPIRQRVSKCSC